MNSNAETAETFTKPSAAIKEAVDQKLVVVNLETGNIYTANGTQLEVKKYKTNGGYVRVKLPNFSAFVYVHRVVAYAIYGDNALKSKYHIHHKDGRRDNNTRSNLELLTERAHRELSSQISKTKWSLHNNEGVYVGSLTDRKYVDILLNSAPELRVREVLGRRNRNKIPDYGTED